MATMLRENDSTFKHLNVARRHKRLCRQVPGGDKYIGPMDASANKLIEKQQESLKKAELREDAYDDVVLADTRLDDGVRTVFESCKKYDRDHGGSQVLKLAFPGEKFSDIVRMPMLLEPDTVEEIKVKIESLGETHELYSLAAQLKVMIDNSRAAINKLNETIREQKLAEADEEIVKNELRRQYECNYLDARKDLGRNMAEMLFPSITSRVQKSEPEEEAA